MGKYNKAEKYQDLKEVYSQCSGPGGLKLAEFIADRMQVQQKKKMLDVGVNRGYQTCFLAKEYDLEMIGIDPWIDRGTDKPHIEFMMDHARNFGVEEKVLGIRVGVPDTLLPNNYFDYVYSTTTLEMVRGFDGKEKYIECLQEIYRILKPGGVFGLGEPMHFDVELPEDLKPYVTGGPLPWATCFATIEETIEAVESVGFKIIEADYAEDASLWWQEYAEYDPFCVQGEDDDYEAIQRDQGRWLSFGYVIAQK